MKINFVKFSKDVICPTKGSVNAAGFDFYSVEDVIIPPSNGRIVQTNVGFKIPRVYFRKVHARSSFGTQFKDVGSGVIDSDYRGRIVVVFFNFFYRTFDINEGCCFAQTIYPKIATPTLTEVSTFDDGTDRNFRAFGSSNMYNKIFVNKYIPEVVPSGLKWYERDGFLEV